MMGRKKWAGLGVIGLLDNEEI